MQSPRACSTDMLQLWKSAVLWNASKGAYHPPTRPTRGSTRIGRVTGWNNCKWPQHAVRQRSATWYGRTRNTPQRICWHVGKGQNLHQHPLFALREVCDPPPHAFSYALSRLCALQPVWTPRNSLFSGTQQAPPLPGQVTCLPPASASSPCRFTHPHPSRLSQNRGAMR